MFTRAVLAAAGIAGVPAAINTVHAADKNNTISSGEKDVTPSDNKIFIHELPLYGEPSSAELVYIPEKPGWLQQNMEPLRDFVMTGVAHSQPGNAFCLADVLRYLRDDSGAIPRAAFITVSGLGGLVAGYRGGIFRKAFYASIGMAAAASICYPDQAVDISKQAWIFTKEQAKEFWRPVKMPDRDGYVIKTEHIVAKQTEEKISTPEKDVVVVAEKTEPTSKVQPKVDHGMSNPEDKDMYTTRSA
ncbi:hypothetical protein LSH36_163g03005 [Paralvinella palmiformis]|uniref:MICOS complex subunit n=1 Tax=Paralvinella palmiformis TaxID=53620 RepID=A0AAD9JT10_9ANNE|nr:hypothetical protein LSH36_163g03005 [Paralvinella palmiformis]